MFLEVETTQNILKTKMNSNAIWKDVLEVGTVEKTWKAKTIDGEF